VIGKIAPNGKSARGLANYLLRRGRGKIVAGTMAGLTPRDLAREFGALRRLNPNLNKAVAHLMLSPAPGDPHLTDCQWQEIAERYAKGMGYANTAWCGVVHNDTDHQHLHILACRIDIHGKTISDANSYRKSEAIVRRLEQDFGLVAVASPASIKRHVATKPETTNKGEIEMHEEQAAATAPIPTGVAPGAQPGNTITDKESLAMRRALVEPSFEVQMKEIFGGDLTRVYRHSSSTTLYFKSSWRIEDSGHRLRVMNYKDSEAVQAAASIVKMAVNPPKCWKSITFTGTDDFVYHAMREAHHVGIEIKAVGQAQLAILAKVEAEAQTLAAQTPLTASPLPNPFEPGTPMHAVWPQPYNLGAVLAEMGMVMQFGAITPGASVAGLLSSGQRTQTQRVCVSSRYVEMANEALGQQLAWVSKTDHGQVLLFRDPGQLFDSGDSLTALGGMDDALAAKRIVALAIHPDRGWKSITFNGSPGFLDLAFREALDHNLPIHTAGEAQAVILAKIMAERAGGMGAITGPTQKITEILKELDDLPPQTVPQTAPQPVPVVVPQAPTPAPTPEAPQPAPVPFTGVAPFHRNLRERLQDRRLHPTPVKLGPAALPKPTQGGPKAP
jgi:hypothetical protein